MPSSNAVDDIAGRLDEIEAALASEDWDALAATTWKLPHEGLATADREGAEQLLGRIRDVEARLASLRAQALDAHAASALLRRAGRAYLRNDGTAGT